MRPKSEVLKFYEDCFDGQHIKCLVCAKKGKTVKYKVAAGCTKTIRDHLENVHRSQWNDLNTGEKGKEAEKAEGENAGNKPRLEASQQTLFQQINKFTKVDPNGALQEKFDKLLLE